LHLKFFLKPEFKIFIKTTNMKKNLFFAILGLTTVFLAASCSKSDSNLAATTTAKATASASAKGVAIATTIEGKWVGNHHSGIDGAYYYLSLEFNTNGVLVVNSSSGDIPEIANGTWSLVGDDVTATYTFEVSGLTYSLAGKFFTTSNIMNGTIGLGTSTTGAGVFSVTKE
jgi:hypothetical protein